MAASGERFDELGLVPCAVLMVVGFGLIALGRALWPAVDSI